MEDTFGARVDKVFGSLASSSALINLWSVTDKEIEKREWNREKDTDGSRLDGQPYPSGADEYLMKKPQSVLQGLDDDEEEEEPDACNDNKKWKKPNPRAASRVVFDIRSSIGLDSTLDYEEEEDEFDKVAVGREEGGDLPYERDIADDGNSRDHMLPSSFKNVTRDPRADHPAAKRRLKEDSESAGNHDSLKLSDATTEPEIEGPITTPQEKAVLN